MNILTNKALPRRTFLRGLGATVALPYLDAMQPAFKRFGIGSSAAEMNKTRLICIESVHGAAGSNAWGANVLRHSTRFCTTSSKNARAAIVLRL